MSNDNDRERTPLSMAEARRREFLLNEKRRQSENDATTTPPSASELVEKFGTHNDTPEVEAWEIDNPDNFGA